MNKLSSILKIVSFGVASFTFLSAHATEPVDSVCHNRCMIFPKGVEFKSEHYRGHVFASSIANKPYYDVSQITFEAGSSNDWHIHKDADQMMLILDGEGYYQEEGQPKRLIRKGDIINTPANVMHWQGAIPDSRLVHLSITDHTDKEHITWVAPVTEEQYNSSLIGTQCKIGNSTTKVEMNTDNTTSSCNQKCQNMVAKEPMQADGIVRLSKIEVKPQYLDEYIGYATEVGEVSLRTEPGVLTMYAVAEKENPCIITILETYSSQEAYRKHIASAHFQKYKQGTLHMVKSLVLSDQTPLNPANRVSNFIQ